jgi:hypothetical protein
MPHGIVAFHAYTTTFQHSYLSCITDVINERQINGTPPFLKRTKESVVSRQSPQEVTNVKQDMRATDNKEQDRKEAEQVSKCMRTPQCQQASSAGSPLRAALPSATAIKEDSESPKLKYTLPPTEIHDDRLFKKVG